MSMWCHFETCTYVHIAQNHIIDTHTNIHIHTHTYIHTHIHTYIQKHTYILRCNAPSCTQFEFENDDKRFISLFCLRLLPIGNWLVTLTAQSSNFNYGKHIEEFADVVKGFRLVYSIDNFLSQIREEDLGVPVAEYQFPSFIMDVPFSGKERPSSKKPNMDWSFLDWWETICRLM